jgi:hypothetical protein
VLTLFTIPKAFVSSIGDAQRVALQSWSALDGVQLVLLGDEPGVAEAAREFGADHLGELARNSEGTPRLDDAFARASVIARHSLLCFANADIVFGPDLPRAVESLPLSRFLLVGQSYDLDSSEVAGKAPLELRRLARDRGVRRGATAIDYFVFPAGLFDPLPQFVVGRAGYDNWLLWRARQEGPVIDATDAVTAVHQRHDYRHLPGGKDQAYYGPEASRNVEIGGGRSRVYTLHDASHRMHADLSIHRNLGSVLRARETVRKVGWKLGVR